MLNIDEAKEIAKTLSALLWQTTVMGKGGLNQPSPCVLHILFQKIYNDDITKQRDIVLSVEQSVYNFLTEDVELSLPARQHWLEQEFSSHLFGERLSEAMYELVQVYRSFEPGGNRYLDMVSWVHGRRNRVLNIEERLNGVAQVLELYRYFGKTWEIGASENKKYALLPYIRRRLTNIEKQYAYATATRKKAEECESFVDVENLYNVVGSSLVTELMGTEVLQKCLHEAFKTGFLTALDQIFLTGRDLGVSSKEGVSFVVTPQKLLGV